MKYRNNKQLDDNIKQAIRTRVERDIYDRVILNTCRKYKFPEAVFNKWFNLTTNE